MVAQTSQPTPRVNSSGPLCLHVFPSFGIGGVPLRMARILTDLGSEFRHQVIALDGNADAQSTLGARLCCSVTALPPQRQNIFSRMLVIRATLRRLRANLLVTYNWGAIE